MTENERIDSGYAALQTESDDVPIQVSGIALGDGDITNGDSGKPTLWPGDVLKEAPLRGSDEALEGQPIATDQNHTTDGTQAQTPSEAVRGAIDWAGFKDDVGVLYEGEIDDPDLARSIENDRLEVSPLISRDIEPLEGELKEKYNEQGYDVEAAEYVATNINGWRDLATVVNGASPSNEITVGANPMKAEALTDTIEALKDVEALKEVAGVEFTGTAEGKLDKSEIDDNFGDHALYGEGENKGDYSYWVVDAEGNLRKGNVESAWQLGCRGQCPSDTTHDERLRELAQEFDSPPEWTEGESESMGSGASDPTNWEACSVSLPQEITQNDDGTQEDKSQSSVAGNSEETMTEEDTLTENEKAILKAAEDVEDATEALNEYAATEGPEIVASSEIESLKEQVDTAKDLYAESLSERWDTDKDKIKSNFGLEALREEFEDEDGDLDTEALIQQPESGEPEETESGTEALGEDADVEKAEALYNDYTTMNRPPKGLEEDITEALGVSDFDDAKEVLD